MIVHLPDCFVLKCPWVDFDEPKCNQERLSSEKKLEWLFALVHISAHLPIGILVSTPQIIPIGGRSGIMEKLGYGPMHRCYETEDNHIPNGYTLK